ncbi:MAG: hypothetical protein HC769_14575 [Cyanobacteria bacterium CRU_2_1]|nr:hypothetical protein [Cyanobacteria bacterium RU_5_0]NJR59949.1 hypothetical protein [Cyanobacteria bacterium CRU_2_1]
MLVTLGEETGGDRNRNKPPRQMPEPSETVTEAATRTLKLGHCLSNRVTMVLGKGLEKGSGKCVKN